jgi:hypothetical protein
MSMCMYIARGREANLREFARDPAALSGLKRSSKVGAFGSPTMSTDQKIAQLEALVEKQPQLRNTLNQFIGMVGGRSANRFGAVAMAAAGAGGGGARLRVLGGGMSGDSGDEPDAGPARPPVLDLHKSWHMFHFLFTGRADGGEPPGSFLMQGGEEVGEDLGYGPPRLVGAADSAAFARFIEAHSLDDLMARLDGERMAALHIYPAFDATDAVEEYGDDLEHYFPKLREHLAAAAAAREATLVWLS